MKTEEVLVKRVLRGYGHERALEGVKKININSLRKALNRLSDSDWIDFCKTISSKSLGKMNFCGFGSFDVPSYRTNAALEYALTVFLDINHLWESEEDQKMCEDCAYRPVCPDKFVPKKYLEKYMNRTPIIDAKGRKKPGFWDWQYIYKRYAIKNALLNSISSSESKNCIEVETEESGLVTFSKLSAWQKRAVLRGFVWCETGTNLYDLEDFRELDKNYFKPKKIQKEVQGDLKRLKIKIAYDHVEKEGLDIRKKDNLITGADGRRLDSDNKKITFLYKWPYAKKWHEISLEEVKELGYKLIDF
ncbi:hypothetical protein [Lactobacillus iners]|uniref:Uncharacterized protein n=1 Tax=Lactobacillus iners TaxID=147802 RepID=A0A6G7BAL7_9LACO|nr:hypothetical protein [Lactobacillus iners]QIH24458.1 hypothetical protein G6Z83_06980 [Lactobacillus iners]